MRELRKKTAKGILKAVKDRYITHEHYKQCLFEEKQLNTNKQGLYKKTTIRLLLPKIKSPFHHSMIKSGLQVMEMNSQAIVLDIISLNSYIYG